MELFEKLPLILDGATGSEMMKYGYSMGSSLEKWILEHPERLKELQSGYIDAGSGAVYAPTFGANRVLLKKYGLGGSVREINLRLAGLSLEVSGGRVPVGGDIAPAGEALEPFGDVKFEELVYVYSEQVEALEEAGVAFYAVETQLSGEEAKAAVTAIRQSSKKPVFVSFTCTESGKSYYGEDFTELLSMFEELGASAFGVNCCGDFGLIKRLVKEMKAEAKIPILVKPNAGKPVVTDGRPVYNLAPEEFAKQMLEIKNLGAGLLGGCCGTGKDHISALAAAIK